MSQILGMSSKPPVFGLKSTSFPCLNQIDIRYIYKYMRGAIILSVSGPTGLKLGWVVGAHQVAPISATRWCSLRVKSADWVQTLLGVMGQVLVGHSYYEQQTGQIFVGHP